MSLAENKNNQHMQEIDSDAQRKRESFVLIDNSSPEIKSREQSKRRRELFWDIVLGVYILLIIGLVVFLEMKG